MKIMFLILFVLTLLHSTVTAYGADNKIPVVIHNNGNNSTPMIFHITGDGGMVRFDTNMSKKYDANGFSFIALSSLKYFFNAKSPAKLAADVVPLIKSYIGQWNKKTLILVGFSFGAEITPFLYERLPSELKDKVKLIVLLTPAKTSAFHIHIRDMIGLDRKKEPYNVAEETAKIKSTKILAVYGDREKSISLKGNNQPNLKILYIKGEHGFRDSNTVFDLIMKELQSAI
jgi:type IV secretory pathway VirJ component